MATKAINKFPKLADTYAGPTLVLADVVNPAAKTGFSTRSMAPDAFLHFELLSPNQSVVEGAKIEVPTLPLNFVIRSGYASFTLMPNSSNLNDSSKETIRQLLFNFGVSFNRADELANLIFIFLNDTPDPGGWGGLDAYGHGTPNPYEKALDNGLIIILDDVPKKEEIIPMIKDALTLATVSLEFGVMEEFENVKWFNTVIHPNGLSIEGQALNRLIPKSTSLGIQITSFQAVQSNVELKGLTLWLRGYFDIPYSSNKPNQNP